MRILHCKMKKFSRNLILTEKKSSKRNLLYSDLLLHGISTEKDAKNNKYSFKTISTQLSLCQYVSRPKLTYNCLQPHMAYDHFIFKYYDIGWFSFHQKYIKPLRREYLQYLSIQNCDWLKIESFYIRPYGKLNPPISAIGLYKFVFRTV